MRQRKRSPSTNGGCTKRFLLRYGWEATLAIRALPIGDEGYVCLMGAV